MQNHLTVNYLLSVPPVMQKTTPECRGGPGAGEQVTCLDLLTLAQPRAISPPPISRW